MGAKCRINWESAKMKGDADEYEDYKEFADEEC